MRPLISIVLAAFNEERFIKEALESILTPYHAREQSYDLEVIAIDDQSSDGTLEIMRSMPHETLTVLQNTGKGKVAAFNLGLSVSKGDYVILFAGDDLFNLDSVEPRIAPMLAAQGPAATFCAIQAFNHSDGALAQRFPRSGGGARAGGAIAMNRTFVDLCLPIPEDMPNEDTWLCLHADNLDVTTTDVDVIGMMYRLHDANTSAVASNDHARQRQALLLRSQVYGTFFERHSNRMTDAKIRAIRQEIAAHAMAGAGNSTAILFLFGYPVMRRIRAFFLSRDGLWRIRSRLGAALSGWVKS